MIEFKGFIPLDKSDYKNSAEVTYTNNIIGSTVYSKIAVSNNKHLYIVPLIGVVSAQNEDYLTLKYPIPLEGIPKILFKYLSKLYTKSIRVPYVSAMYGVHPELIYSNLRSSYEKFLSKNGT